MVNYLIVPSGTYTTDAQLPGMKSSYFIQLANILDQTAYQTTAFTSNDSIIFELNSLYPSSINWSDVITLIKSNTASNELNIILYFNPDKSYPTFTDQNFFINVDDKLLSIYFDIPTGVDPKIQQLNITNCSKITSIDFEFLTYITSINFSGCPLFASNLEVKPTKRFPNLISVDASNTSITNFKYTYGIIKIINLSDSKLENLVLPTDSSTIEILEVLDLNNCQSVTTKQFSFQTYTSLQSLFLDNIGLTNLTIGESLKILSVKNNLNLLSINLPANLNLNTIYLQNTGITKLNLSNSPLTGMDLSDTALKLLNLSNTQLINLNFANSLLEELDISGVTTLKILNIPSETKTTIKTLDMSNVNLTNPIQDFSDFSVIESLNISNTGITSFIPPQLNTIGSLNLSNNLNTSGELDLSGKSNLTTLDISNTGYTIINLSGTNVLNVNLENRNIEQINLSDNQNLKSINLKNLNNLTTLTVGNNSSLDGISIINCSIIEQLDLSQLNSLSLLYLDNLPNLTSLNGENIQIILFQIYNFNEIKFDIYSIKQVDNLNILNCYNLIEIDISNFSTLQGLSLLGTKDLENIKGNIEKLITLNIGSTKIKSVSQDPINISSIENNLLEILGGKNSKIVQCRSSITKEIQIGNVIYCNGENDLFSYLEYIEQLGISPEELLFISCNFFYFNINSDLYQKYKNYNNIFPQRFITNGIEYIAGPSKNSDEYTKGYCKLKNDITINISDLSNQESYCVDTNNKNIYFEGNSFSEYSPCIWIFNMNQTTLNNLKTILSTESVKQTIYEYFNLYTNTDPSEFSDILDRNGNPINVHFIQMWPENEPIPIPEPEPTENSNKFICKFII